MLLSGLLDALRVELLRRIHAGDFSERSLARRAGLSQSHVHNVLKNARPLSPRVADALLVAIRCSVLDLAAAEAPRKPPVSESGGTGSYRGRTASE